MKRVKFDKEQFEGTFDNSDVYSEDIRKREVDDDELEPWEAAWMRGYDEAG